MFRQTFQQCKVQPSAEDFLDLLVGEGRCRELEDLLEFLPVQQFPTPEKLGARRLQRLQKFRGHERQLQANMLDGAACRRELQAELRRLAVERRALDIEELLRLRARLHGARNRRRLEGECGARRDLG
jgi:hypothetical protein